MWICVVRDSSTDGLVDCHPPAGGGQSTDGGDSGSSPAACAQNVRFGVPRGGLPEALLLWAGQTRVGKGVRRFYVRNVVGICCLERVWGDGKSRDPVWWWNTGRPPSGVCWSFQSG